MKTARDVLDEHMDYDRTKHSIVEAMELYAQQFIDAFVSKWDKGAINQEAITEIQKHNPCGPL